MLESVFAMSGAVLMIFAALSAAYQLYSALHWLIGTALVCFVFALVAQWIGVAGCVQ